MPLEERRIQIKQPITQISHSLSMENREKLSITGVEDVANFTEEVVVLISNMGVLTIKGNGLHINKLNVESGEIIIEGNINVCEYSDRDIGKRGAGFFSKLFK
ncbi:MAG: sporulation protein YabP [Clostridia bacterium]|nr:sporulation protein YabP [Clostridia bacterium]